MFWIISAVVVLVLLAGAAIILNRRSQAGSAGGQDELRDAWQGRQNPYNAAPHGRGNDVAGGAGGV